MPAHDTFATTGPARVRAGAGEDLLVSERLVSQRLDRQAAGELRAVAGPNIAVVGNPQVAGKGCGCGKQ